MNRSRFAFTLIELLVCVAIIALLVSIALPAISSARRSSNDSVCMANLRSHASMTFLYLNNHNDQFPTRSATNDPGGGSVFGAFMPTRAILTYDERPLGIFACPEDKEPVRLYPAGISTGAMPEGLGVGDQYNIAPTTLLRYSFGINNMTGIVPKDDDERRIFNQTLTAYPYPVRTLLYADCTWVNARGHRRVVNDSPALKGRIANAAAPHRIDSLVGIPAEYSVPSPRLRRHRRGSNILFMDGHGEVASQKDCFSRVLYSWTEK